MADEETGFLPSGESPEQSEAPLQQGILGASESSQSDNIIGQPQFGTVNFSPPEIPDSIRSTFQNASSGQSAAVPTVSSLASNAASPAISSAATTNLQFETTRERPAAFGQNTSLEGKNHSLKLSNVKFIDNLKEEEKVVHEEGVLAAGPQINRDAGTMENLFRSLLSPSELAEFSNIPKAEPIKERPAAEPVQTKKPTEAELFAASIATSLPVKADSLSAASPEQRLAPAAGRTFSEASSANVPIGTASNQVEFSKAYSPDSSFTVGKRLDESLETLRQEIKAKDEAISPPPAELEKVESSATSEAPQAPHSRSERLAAAANPDAVGRKHGEAAAGATRLDRVHAEQEELEQQKQEAKQNRKGFWENRDKKSILRFVIFGVIAVVVILLIAAFFFVTGSLSAVNPSNTDEKTVTIADGASSKTIATQLSRDGLIKNATIFEFYTKIKGIGNFKSGSYQLSQAMSPDEIAKKLETGAAAESADSGKISIAEGSSINQMAGSIAKNADGATTPFTAADFKKAVADPTFIAEMVQKYPTLLASLPAANSGVAYQLEGYLSAGDYSYSSKTTLQELISQMLAKTDKTLQPYYSELPAKDLSVNDLLSLSALTEKEAATTNDREGVAEVFLNRLNQGMPLASNAALLYAEGKPTDTLASDVTDVDATINSPFNLNTQTGMGPGPIDSPSSDAIKAVLNHARNNNLYFVADPTTNTLYFATTQAQQDANVAKYLKK